MHWLCTYLWKAVFDWVAFVGCLLELNEIVDGWLMIFLFCFAKDIEEQTNVELRLLLE